MLAFPLSKPPVISVSLSTIVWLKAAADIVKRALEIAGELCIYTNQHHTVETLGADSRG